LGIFQNSRFLKKMEEDVGMKKHFLNLSLTARYRIYRIGLLVASWFRRVKNRIVEHLSKSQAKNFILKQKHWMQNKSIRLAIYLPQPRELTGLGKTFPEKTNTPGKTFPKT